MGKENYNYFDEFIKLSDYIVKSAGVLKDIFENFDINKVEEKILEVHKIENEADDVIHKMRNNLIKEFLPPIDREDITAIANKLDDIEDSIDEILINIKILNITEIKKDVIELIDILILITNTVKEMILNFKNFRKIDLIKTKIIEVNELEEKGDRAYEKVIYLLYKNETNPINLIKWTTIYNMFENAMDHCEQLSDFVEDVILTNS